MLQQRRSIREHSNNKIYFSPNDYPSDRIVICIEEPFQKDNVARAVFDKEKAVRIVRTLRYCRERFEEIREKEECPLTLTTVSQIAEEYRSAAGRDIMEIIQGKRRKRSIGASNHTI